MSRFRGYEILGELCNFFPSPKSGELNTFPVTLKIIYQAPFADRHEADYTPFL